MYDKKTYVNEAQRPFPDPISAGNDYIGLTEDEALLRAERMKINARVIERDGEPLPTTMDLVYGRHNFSVKGGLVYKVDVEGENIESPEMVE